MMHKLLIYAAGLQNIGIHIARWGIVVILFWIGSVTALRNESYGTVPLVSDSPNIEFPNNFRAPKYKQTSNGDYKPDHIAWHLASDADAFSYIMGSLMILSAVMIALYPMLPAVSAGGSFLAFITSLVTLLSLIIIPETGMAVLGDAEYKFPYLSIDGRLVVMGVIILGAGIASMAQAAKKYLKKTTQG